jgi:hypothetical protein
VPQPGGVKEIYRAEVRDDVPDAVGYELDDAFT